MSRHRFDAVLGAGEDGDLPAVVLPAEVAAAMGGRARIRPETHARRLALAVAAARTRTQYPGTVPGGLAHHRRQGG
jgi:hypothetical protein